MKTITNKFKLALVAVGLLAIGSVNAQQTSGDATAADGTTTIGKIEDLSKSSVLNGTIRVIDNKGTKKFLQVKNGLTLLTDATPSGGIVSTWQLGGTLTDNTYIGAAGKTFSLDGLKLVAPADVASTSATDQSIGSNQTTISGTGTASTDTGWTILVRDEATGEIKKILATDLVKTGRLGIAATVDGTAPALADASIPADLSKVSVYRNGAKLIAGDDYTVAAGSVTLTPQAPANAPQDWEIYNGDYFEVHWIN